MDPDYKISTENNASDDSSEIVDTQNETICEETYVTYEYAELPGKKKWNEKLLIKNRSEVLWMNIVPVIWWV